MDDPVDVRANAVARSQRGRATRRQLRETASISPATIHRRLARGQWTECVPTVIDLGTHPDSWEASLQALLLGAGPDAWASHLTAAHLHRFLDVGRPPRHDVLVRRGDAAHVAGVPLHTTAAVAVDELTVVRGFPVTTPGRTLLDLAGRATHDELERLALHLARTDRAALRQVGVLLDRYPGRSGRQRLIEAVSRLPADAANLGSPLEIGAVQEFRRLDAPPFVLQHEVRDAAGNRIRRVDVAWVDLGALAELDGASHHDPSTTRREDAAVRGQMRALGWQVEVFRHADLGGPRMAAFVADLRRRAADLEGR